MKTILILALLVASVAQAETIREANIRKEMVERITKINVSLSLARTSLKKKEVVPACEKIKDSLTLSEDHLMDVGTRLDPINAKNTQMRQSSLQTVMVLHKMEAVCGKGKNSEYVDPKQFGKDLKAIVKDFKKQKKRVKKVNVGFDNDFDYDYKLNF